MYSGNFFVIEGWLASLYISGSAPSWPKRELTCVRCAQRWIAHRWSWEKTRASPMTMCLICRPSKKQSTATVCAFSLMGKEIKMFNRYIPCGIQTRTHAPETLLWFSTGRFITFPVYIQYYTLDFSGSLCT